MNEWSMSWLIHTSYLTHLTYLFTASPLQLGTSTITVQEDTSYHVKSIHVICHWPYRGLLCITRNTKIELRYCQIKPLKEKRMGRDALIKKHHCLTTSANIIKNSRNMPLHTMHSLMGDSMGHISFASARLFFPEIGRNKSKHSLLALLLLCVLPLLLLKCFYSNTKFLFIYYKQVQIHAHWF